MAKKSGMVFMLGAALGALAGMLLAPKSGKKNREWVQQKVVELNITLKKSGVDKDIKQFFAEKSDETTELYNEVKDSVLTRAAHLYKEAGKLTEEDYSAAIEKTLMHFKKNLETSKAKLVPLRAHFKNQWKNIKREFEKRIES
ncbi:MAG: hypothetical protein NUV52_04485 [Candidatus Roizmanbacteria bacterium]|nr:hypothetical protein [Candidatus Roizmanbacteria bacterium]